MLVFFTGSISTFYQLKDNPILVALISSCITAIFSYLVLTKVGKINFSLQKKDKKLEQSKEDREKVMKNDILEGIRTIVLESEQRLEQKICGVEQRLEQKIEKNTILIEKNAELIKDNSSKIDKMRLDLEVTNGNLHTLVSVLNERFDKQIELRNKS